MLKRALAISKKTGKPISKCVLTRKQEVEVAVVVVIAPSHISVAHRDQTGVLVRYQHATVIIVEQALGFPTAILTHDSKVEIAICIDIPPTHSSLVKGA